MSDCPSCGSPNAENAAECASCGLIFAKWKARQERERAKQEEEKAKRERTEKEIEEFPAQLEDNVPKSWDEAKDNARVRLAWVKGRAPNFAAIGWLLVALVAMVIVAMAPSGRLVEGGAFTSLLAAIFSLFALVPVAARLTYAPIVATVAVAGIVIVQSPLMALALLPVPLVWIRTDVYIRAWHPARIPGWLAQGLRALIRPGRASVGMALFGTALFFGVLLIFALDMARTTAGAESMLATSGMRRVFIGAVGSAMLLIGSTFSPAIVAKPDDEKDPE